MKKLVTLMALAWTTLASAQTADQFITAGRNDLALTNWWGADTNFTAALAAPNGSTNETANALKAVTRLLVLPQTPAGSNFLVALGFPKTNLYLPGFPFASLPKDINGDPIFPVNYDSASVVAFFRTNILKAITNSGANLANITDLNYTLSLSANETLIESVTVDYGDIQMLRALLSAMQFWGHTINANNFSVVIPQVESWIETNGFTYQSALAAYPSLLAMQNPGDLAASESALTNAIADYFAASAFIRNRPADATNRLFELDTNNISKEAKFRTELANVLLSLNGPTEFNTNNYTSTINAAAWFSGTHSLRSLMPQFNGDAYVSDSLPDYTFGGILPYARAYETEDLLRKEFHSYAGIYIGDNGQYYNGNPAVSDNQGYQNGSFAVFVGTNQQATLMGHDDGDGSGNSNFGMAAQFDVKKGNWQFTSNDVSGYGYIDKDGSFNGELDYLNGTTVWLNGHQQSPLGPFQNPAGLYSGTFNANDNGNPISGTLQVIVAADGEVHYVPISAYGVGSGGGPGQLNSNNQFSDTSVTGTTVSGTLDTNTLLISGILSGNITGGFSASRAANIPFDLPPVITTNLPSNLTGPPGTNVTLFLAATGSPPMCFQWFSNDVAIPFATTNSLVVSNLQTSSSGTYSVSINNAVGETNAAAMLNATASLRPVLDSAGFLSGSQFQLQINGVAGQNYTLQMSTNLASTNWLSILVTNAPGGSFFLTDTNATNLDRFYRISVGP